MSDALEMCVCAAPVRDGQPRRTWYKIHGTRYPRQAPTGPTRTCWPNTLICRSACLFAGAAPGCFFFFGPTWNLLCCAGRRPPTTRPDLCFETRSEDFSTPSSPSRFGLAPGTASTHTGDQCPPPQQHSTPRRLRPPPSSLSIFPHTTPISVLSALSKPREHRLQPHSQRPPREPTIRAYQPSNKDTPPTRRPRSA